MLKLMNGRVVGATVLIGGLLIILLVCLKLALVRRPACNGIPRVPTNGDLVFVEYQSLYATLIKLATGQPWSHVGLYLNGHVIELAHYPTTATDSDTDSDNSLRIIPLQEWLKLNSHRQIHWRKYTGPPIPDMDPREFVLQHFGTDCIELDLDLINWMRSLVVWLPPIDRGKTVPQYYCSEFVAKCIQALGVPLDRHPQKYSPGDFAE